MRKKEDACRLDAGLQGDRFRLVRPDCPAESVQPNLSSRAMDPRDSAGNMRPLDCSRRGIYQKRCLGQIDRKDSLLSVLSVAPDLRVEKLCSKIRCLTHRVVCDTTLCFCCRSGMRRRIRQS